MPKTLNFGPKPKTATERSELYRQRQAGKGACYLSFFLDAETARMLDALVKNRGNQKGGGKTGAVKAAIRHLYSVSCNVK
jgi:hypothetical protein